METFKLTKKFVASKLPKRPRYANKGTFGKVLVIAGSINFPGAAYLACAGAYRVGAGLVTLVTTKSVQKILGRKLPEVTFIEQAFDTVNEKLHDYDVVLIGPGLGREKKIAEFVHEILRQYDLPPIVLDGDGLNILAEIKNWWEEIIEYGVHMVLTPHPGELARLTGLTVEEIQQDREKFARKYADTWRQVVVLKGANTVIAFPTGELIIASFANPALATAGTGDVLSGNIASFIGQGLSLFDAACCGVYIHGLAGDELRKKFGDAGSLASDLLPILPKIIQRIRKVDQ